MRIPEHVLERRRRSGAMQEVPAQGTAMFLGVKNRLPILGEEDIRRCRRGLEALRRMLAAASLRDLARRGLKKIVVWDPDDDAVCAELVYEGQHDDESDQPARFPCDRRWVNVRYRDLVAVQWAFNRPGGIAQLVRLVGVRDMILDWPPDVLKGHCLPGALLGNHIGPDIYPNHDYSIRPFGLVEYHS